MNTTDKRIPKFKQQGCSPERIAKKLDRELDKELLERINKMK
jgi:hypothetical protein